MKGYQQPSQTEKNLAWFLPRPKKDRYKGGMPLYAEEWLIELAKDILEEEDITLVNLFSGMTQYGVRVDIKEEVKPDICEDAHDFAKHFEKESVDVILADPPYSNEESEELYGTGNLKYKTWTAECDQILREGGLLIVYHKYVMPNPNPEKYEVVKRVFIGNRTYHLPRVAIYFRKRL
jgi:16S rRNA G966 N2-methylase RsmD